MTQFSLAQEMQDAYMVVGTDQFEHSHSFYRDTLGFQPVFESSWFVYYKLPNPQFGFAIMDKNHPSTPPAQEAFKGGSFLTIQLDDVQAYYEQLKDKYPIHYALTDEDWGQRRFGIISPEGMYIDFVQQIPPKAGYWEQYSK